MDKQRTIEMKNASAEADEQKQQQRLKNQQSQIDSLKDIHGGQLEQLCHNKEKLRALQIELAERNKYHKKLIDRQNEEQENMLKDHKHYDLSARADPLGREDDRKDEFHLKIIDKLTMNLDRLTTIIDGKIKEDFSIHEKTEEPGINASDTYSKPYFIAACVKYIEKVENGPEPSKQNTNLKLMNEFLLGEEEKKEVKQENVYFNTFRISKNTNLLHLKQHAAEFWSLPPASQEKEMKDKEGTIAPNEKDKATAMGKRLKDKYDKYHNYELLDEYSNEIILSGPNAPTVESFFQTKGLEYTQALIMLRKRETDNEVLKDAENEKGKDKNANVLIKIRGEEDYLYNEFYKRFPGMKKYIKINLSKEKKKSGEGEGFIFNDNHFCVFFWMVIMLLLNILSVVGGLLIPINYRNNDNILTLLSAVPNFRTNTPANDSVFYAVINSDYYYNYLRNIVGPQLFYDSSDSDSSEPKIYSTYVIAGKVVLRQIKISPRTCIMYQNNAPACSYPFYTKDLRYEGEPNTTTNDLFETEQSTKISEVFTAEFGVYDGSGFIKQFPPYNDSLDSNSTGNSTNSSTSTRQTFLDAITLLQSTGYIDPYTIAIFLQFNLYNPNQDIWTYVNLLVEISPTGAFFAYPATLKHFYLDLYSGPSGELLKATDILKGIICVFLMIFILYFVFCSRQMGEFNFAYLSSFQGICNTLIVVFSYITIYYSNKQTSLGFNETDLFTSSIYTDLSDCANYFNGYYVSESILIAILILRCFIVFKINKRFNILIKTLESAQQDIFNYSIILFPILLGYAVLGQSIYGNQMVDFSNFSRSFISVLMLTIGQLDSEKMQKVSPTMTLPFLLILYMIIVFFLQSLFLGIYIDNYRTVVLELGFLYEKEPSWTPKEYIKWMLFWMPKKCLKNLKLLGVEENIKKYN